MRTAVFITLGALLVIAFGCSNEGGGFFARLLRGGGSALPVTVESVTVEDRSQAFRVPATLDPSEVIDVTLTEDAAIEHIFVQEGSLVNPGDPLFKLSEQDINLRLAKLRSDLKDAQATLEKNTYFLKNRDRLLSEGRIDQGQYDALPSEVSSNEADAERTQIEVTRAEERSRDTMVASPIIGVVSRINTAAGLTVPTAKPIMSIVKPDPMTASFRVSAGNAGAVRPGTAVMIKFPDLGGETAPAKVTSVGSEINPSDNTFEAKAAIPNPTARYKSGMRAEAEFQSPEKLRVFVIPEEALIKESRAFFVFTVVKGVAHKVQVIPDETIGTRVEISRGLKEDDLVVVKGNDKLTEGAVVDIWGGKTTR